MTQSNGKWVSGEVITAAGLNSTYTSDGDLKTRSAGMIADANGNEIIKFPATVASAVNEITVTPAATGGTPTISATGGDANIDLTLTPKGSGQAVVDGNTIISSDNQLTGGTADGFPNTTTTYIWNFDSSADGDQTDVVGSKVLTRAGANALTEAADVLGVSRYNTCGAETYLTSTDTAFNVANTADTDDFMIGGWVYLATVAPAGNQVLFGNSPDLGAHGYCTYIGSNGTLYASLWGGTDVEASCPIVAGWHHVVQVREVGVAQYLFVDGVLMATSADTTIGTTQTKFQVSGYNHGANFIMETGTRFDEIFFRKGVLPTNLPDVIRNIYARSAKKFAVKDQASNVFIPVNEVIFKNGTLQRDIATNGTETIELGFTPKRVRITATCNPAYGYLVCGVFTKGSNASIYSFNSGYTYSDGNLRIATASDNYTNGTFAFTATGFTISFTKLNSPTGTITLLWEAEG